MYNKKQSFCQPKSEKLKNFKSSDVIKDYRHEFLHFLLLLRILFGNFAFLKT